MCSGLNVWPFEDEVVNEGILGCISVDGLVDVGPSGS
jgi:hypothetical protein